MSVGSLAKGAKLSSQQLISSPYRSAESHSKMGNMLGELSKSRENLDENVVRFSPTFRICFVSPSPCMPPPLLQLGLKKVP